MFLDFLKVSFILVLVIGSLVVLGVGIIKFIDYLEENPYASKHFIQKIVYGSVAFHTVFLLIGISIPQILFSLSIQYSYNCLFDSYPVIRPEDPKFIYGLVGSLINYFLMIRFISMNSIRLLVVVPCFFIVWLTPVCFFFSMSATEDTLFIKKTGRKNKTYAGMLLDFLFSLGRKDKANKN